VKAEKITVIPAQPGWRLLDWAQESGEVWEEPIIAWRIETYPRNVDSKHVEFNDSTWPICVGMVSSAAWEEQCTIYPNDLVSVLPNGPIGINMEEFFAYLLAEGLIKQKGRLVVGLGK
jgi:hypothetical protein